MATAADAEKEYARLQEFLTSTDQIDLTEGRVGFVRIKNVRYTLDQVRALRADAENRIAQLDTVLAPVREAQAKLARAEEIARNPIVESPTGMSQAQADADVADAREELKRVTTRQVNIPKAAPLAAAPAAPAAGLTAEQKKALRGRSEVAGGMGATAPRKTEETTDATGGGAAGGAAVGAGRGATVVTGGKSSVKWSPDRHGISMLTPPKTRTSRRLFRMLSSTRRGKHLRHRPGSWSSSRDRRFTRNCNPHRRFVRSRLLSVTSGLTRCRSTSS